MSDTIMMTTLSGTFLATRDVVYEAWGRVALFLQNADGRIGEDGAATCVIAENWLMLAEDARAAQVLLERGLGRVVVLCDSNPSPGEPAYAVLDLRGPLAKAVRCFDLGCYGVQAIGQTLGSAGTVLGAEDMQGVADTVADTFATAAEADLSRVLLLLDSLLPKARALH